MTPNSNSLNVDIQNALDVVCDACGGRLFREVTLIKRVSALLSPTGKEILAPVQTFCCASCSHLNTEFDPFKKSLV